MILISLTLVILVPLLFVAGMAWVVTGLPTKLTFWSTFVTFLILVISTVAVFLATFWAVLELGWTK